MQRRLIGLIFFGVVIAIVASRTRATSPAQTSPVQVDVTVTEPAGVARTNGIVTSGVPIPLTATQSAWSLFDGATEIPVQTTLLTGVKTPWVLLDFQSTVAANASATYTLKEQPPTVSVANPVTVTEAANSSTIVTGPIKAVISKTNFNLFDNVWYDANHNGVFETGEQVVAPTVNDNLPLVSGTSSGLTSGTTLTGHGTPTSFVWETLGPIRSTLKVEGFYGTPADPLLKYTTRITFTAGSSAVTIEHLLRNSFSGEERYVKVQSAKLIVGGIGKSLRTAKSGSQLWSTVTATGVATELIPPTLDISTAYDPNATPFVSRQNTTINVDANGGMVVGDWSYHGATVQLDFNSTLTAPQQAANTTAASDRLVALADASWYSDRGAFGEEHFSTLDDEKKAYQNWGWTWPTNGNAWSTPPIIPRVKNTYRVDWNTTDANNDFEADDVAMNLMMYVRTAARGYLDRTDAMARYWKWEFAWRTDGFAYLRNEYWSGPNHPTVFPRQDLPTGSLTTNDNYYINNNIKNYGKVTVDHSWNTGIVTYAYMFGDRDALATAIDLAEQSRQASSWRPAGTTLGAIGANVRGEARQLSNILSVWEATADSSWKTAADHMRDMFVTSVSYDQRGFYYGLTCDYGVSACNRMPGGKYFSGFMVPIASNALYRYWILTNDAAAKKIILQMADFALAHATNSQGYMGDYTVVDWPVAGNVVQLSYDQFRNANPVTLYPYSTSTESFVDTLTIAYRMTGNVDYLNQAKFLWGKTSRRLGVQPYTTLIANDTQVGRFVNSLQGTSPSGTFFPENGDLTANQFLFYEAARLDILNPGPVLDLNTK